MSRIRRQLGPSLAAALCLAACQEPPCPGLPDEIPAAWGESPPGFERSALDVFVREQMREGCIPALSVAIVDRDRLILSAAWGWANLERERAVEIDTPFMLASVSKAVDALAILAARDEGLLSLDDPVSKLVGFEVENPRIGLGGSPVIRLEHLVTHSSGIRDNWDILDGTYFPGDPEEGLDDFLHGYLHPAGVHYDKRRNFFSWPAGREWMYSNVGAALAGLSVQSVAGEPYEDFCAGRLFEPLGLRSTHWFLREFEDPERIARPHTMTWDGWEVLEHYGYPTFPDGQLRSTATELSQLLRLALGDGEVDGQRVLERGVYAALTTEPVPGLADWFLRDYIRAQYLFWFEADFEGRRIIGHDGDDLGVSTEMFFDPETGVGVVLLANVQDNENQSSVREATTRIEVELFEIGARE